MTRELAQTLFLNLQFINRGLSAEERQRLLFFFDGPEKIAHYDQMLEDMGLIF